MMHNRPKRRATTRTRTQAQKNRLLSMAKSRRHRKRRRFNRKMTMRNNRSITNLQLPASRISSSTWKRPTLSNRKITRLRTGQRCRQLARAKATMAPPTMKLRSPISTQLGDSRFVSPWRTMTLLRAAKSSALSAASLTVAAVTNKGISALIWVRRLAAFIITSLEAVPAIMPVANQTIT